MLPRTAEPPACSCQSAISEMAAAGGMLLSDDVNLIKTDRSTEPQSQWHTTFRPSGFAGALPVARAKIHNTKVFHV
jgi:hypothetical protein